MNDKFDTLKGEIAEVIKPNGQRLIKGGNHQATLFKVVDAMEAVDAESKARDTAIEVKVTANTDAIAAVDGRVTAHAEVIADHETRITDNTSAIADNKAELTRQGVIVDGHSQDITDIKHKDALQDAHLTQIDGTLGEISGDIEGIHQTDNVQNDAIADLQGKVADLADSALAFDVTPLVNAIGGKISEAFGKELIHAIRAGKWLYAKANQDTYYRIISCGVLSGKRIFTSAEGREVRNIYLDGLSVSLDTHVIGADVHIFNNRESVNILNLTTQSSAAHIKEVFTDSFGEVLIPHTGDIFNIHANSDVMHSGIVVSSVEDRAEIRIAVDMSNFEDNLVHRVFYKIHLPAQGFDSIEIVGKTENIINPSKIAEDAIDRMQSEINANKGGIAENKQTIENNKTEVNATIATNKTEAERAIAKVANEVNEYNISHINKQVYDLPTAIAALNAYLGSGARTMGLKMTYADNKTMKPVTQTYQGGSFVSPASWKNEFVDLFRSIMAQINPKCILPKWFMDALVCWYNPSRQGLRNGIDIKDGEPFLLQDFSGNGHDMTMYNFQGAGMSGMDGYAQLIKNWASTEKAFSVVTNNKKIEVEVISQPNGTYFSILRGFMNEDFDYTLTTTSPNPLYIRYFKKGGGAGDILMKEGKNTFKRIEDLDSEKDVFFRSEGKLNVGEKVIFEQLPLYEGALVFDGTDDYGVSRNQPILDDYTIIMNRKILFFEKLGIGGLVTKSIGGSIIESGAFIFERKYDTISYGNPNKIKTEKDGISWQTKKLYNGKPIQTSENTDTREMNLGALFKGEYLSSFALYDFLLFNRTLTPEEIDFVKYEVMGEPRPTEQTI